MKIHKVTDREVEICGWAMENETEGCVKLAMQMQLAMLMEIRNDVLELKKSTWRKIMEKLFGSPKVKKQKVYATPTGNKEDIIVGGGRDPLKEGYQPKPTGEEGEIKAPQGGTGEITHKCRGDYKGKCKCADKEPEEPKVIRIVEGSESKGGVGKKPSGKRPEPPKGQGGAFKNGGGI